MPTAPVGPHAQRAHLDSRSERSPHCQSYLDAHAPNPGTTVTVHGRSRTTVRSGRPRFCALGRPEHGSTRARTLRSPGPATILAPERACDSPLPLERRGYLRGETDVNERRPTGALEQEVLVHLWALGQPATPAEVLAELDDDLAYTTVMTILTRLWQKDLVVRTRAGRAFAYEPAVTEAELTARRMHEFLAASSDPKAALVTFVGSLSRSQARALQQRLGAAEKQRRR